MSHWLKLVARIVKQDDKYVVLSEHGKKLGSYPTREQAQKRLKQIEYFKHRGK